MQWISYVIVYLAILFFLIVVAVRFIWFCRMPLHLRWELYPVPHEGKGRDQYGGSYFEEVSWWAKPFQKSQLNVIKAMIPEMLFLVSIYRNNRSLWWWTFSFHFGLYMIILSIGLLGLNAFLHIFAWYSLLGHNGIISLPIITIRFGITLSFIGSMGLLLRRFLDSKLHAYTNKVDLIHLVLFAGFSIYSGAVIYFIDPKLIYFNQFLVNLLTLNLKPIIENDLFDGWIIFSSLLIAYIPMTRMAHFFLKWFTYHGIRWDDEINRVGSPMEKKLAEQLAFKVSWSADHLKKDCGKTWLDVATSGVSEKNVHKK